MNTDEVKQWVETAERMLAKGEMDGMRACGRELLEQGENCIEGLAVVAEASVYLGDFDEAERMLDRLWSLPEQQNALEASLRGLYATAAFYGAQYQLEKAMAAYEQLFRRYDLAVDQSVWSSIDHLIIERACGFYGDTCLLAGYPEKSQAAIFKASHITEDFDKKAFYHSKGLFLSNYRESGNLNQLELHRQFSRLLRTEMSFPHDVEKRRSKHSLRIGYISPDFRQHAAAYFFAPLLRDADREHFSLYVYFTGKADHVTQRFRKMGAKWRDVSGKEPAQIAHQIYGDRIDILVDLSGHSQGSCLAVMNYRPAPVQVSGIGYINTTGLDKIDFFLTDQVCCPKGVGNNFLIEMPLRMDRCHLCYAPDVMRDIKYQGGNAPVFSKGYITFASFNNFAKVTDQQLLMWRNILDGVKYSRLIIKSKTCSVPDGQAIIRKRFAQIGGDISRLELRPFSPDYLMQYKEVDIALDTYPYNGGLTTCDALFMGVPVISMAGCSHGSRYGETLLKAVGLPELVADGERTYISKAIQLARNVEVLNKLHKELPGMMRSSSLMDGKSYMRDLEDKYIKIWNAYCKV